LGGILRPTAQGPIDCDVDVPPGCDLPTVVLVEEGGVGIHLSVSDLHRMMGPPWTTNLPSRRGEGRRKHLDSRVDPSAHLGCQEKSFLLQVGKKLYRKRASLSYCVITYGTWAFLLQYVYPLVDIVSNVKAYHKCIGIILLFFCFLTWLLACIVSPGSITRESLARYAHYPYDNVLYTDEVCPTLHIRKVARSKYDRWTRARIPKFDHYCPVVGQAVGEENYRFFLLFLFMHTAACYYGSIMVAQIWRGLLRISSSQRRNVPEELMHATVTIRRIAFVWVLITIMTGAISLFLAFQLYLIYNGMTTNEWYKWHRLQQEEFNQRRETSIKGFDEETGGHSIPKSEIPRNMYDKGPYHNFKEVLFPLSIRKRKLGHSIL